MAIRLTRFPAYGVNVTVYSGKVSRDLLLAHYASIDAGDGANAGRWISYFDPTADLSELDLATFAELKRVVGAKIRELYGDQRLLTAIVCDSRINQPLLNVWKSYVGGDRDHPSEPVMFTSLKAACDWLGLPDEARAQMSAAVGVAIAGQPQAQPRSGFGG